MERLFIQDSEFYKRVIRLAIPIILQNLLTNTLNIIDSFIVGSLGETALAAVTLTNIPIKVVTMFSFGAQSGVSILISQYWGKRDKGSINRALGVGLWIVTLVNAIYSFIIIKSPVGFLSIFSNEPAIIEEARQYAVLVSLSYLFNTFSLVYLAMLRSTERPLFGTYVLSGSTLLKLFLDFALIEGKFGSASLGIFGAGMATLITRVVEFLFILGHMFTNKVVPIQWRSLLLPGKQMVLRFAKNAGTVIFNETVWGLGISTISNVMSHMEGSVAILSAYSVATNVESLVTSICSGLHNTAAVIIGSEIGSGRRTSILKKMGYSLVALALTVGFCAGLLMYLISTAIGESLIFPIFHLSEEASDICLMMIGVLSLVLPFRALNNTAVVGVLRGGGDVRVAALIDVLPLWIGAVPYALFVGSVLHAGIFWVMLSYLVQYLIQTAFAVSRLRSDRWIHQVT